ncbi:chorismate mutase [Tatumella morbirosei]|uniref:chorismate mutase n=1 Tax=Tatumella morbirosei TaxID=642227 RepID=A0A095UJX5_9GAMM|nr:chorismate mutase [Tatumella morbirosei]KGD74738.1 chorismate mutase [Tatumella morbirosei]
MKYQSIADVRQDIDRLDSQLVRLLAERQICVQAAAGFKTDPGLIPAPERVAAVIDRIKVLAEQQGLSVTVAERVWREMISSFIALETEFHQQTDRS